MGRREFAIVGKVILLLVIAVLLQTVLFSHIRVLGVTADLFLLLTIIVAVCRGPAEGAIFGFFTGIFADIMYFSPLGVRALIYVLVGYFVGTFVLRFNAVSPWSVALLAGVSSFLAQFMFGLFQYIMGPRGGFLTMLGVQVVPEAVFDALVTAPLYVLLIRSRLLPAPRVDGPSLADDE